MVIHAKIRMSWTFSGTDQDHGRFEIVEAMRKDGMQKEAIEKILAADFMHIAEVVIDSSGSMKIEKIYPMHQCGARHENGAICNKDAEHGKHHAQVLPIADGCSVFRWTSK